MTNFIEGVLLASAARTATTSAEGPTNGGLSGVVLILDVTAAAGGGETLTPSLQIWIPGKGDWVAVTAFSTQTATGTYVYIISSGGIETAAIAGQEVAAVPLPLGRWRATITNSAAGSWTYSLSYKGVV